MNGQLREIQEQLTHKTFQVLLLQEDNMKLENHLKIEKAIGYSKLTRRLQLDIELRRAKRESLILLGLMLLTALLVFI